MSEGFHLPKSYVERMVEEKIRGDLGKFNSLTRGKGKTFQGRSLNEKTSAISNDLTDILSDGLKRM